MINPDSSLARVLVVDDHRKIRETLATILRKNKFDVLTAENAAGMRQLLDRYAFDIILLDIMLPDADGFTLCQQLSFGDASIILLTALGAVPDRVKGLELGAEDYIIKPFEPSELIARINTILRRRQRATGVMPAMLQDKKTRHYYFAGCTFTPACSQLRSETGASITLSSVENRLLSAFIQHPHTLLSRDRLLDLCTRPNADPFPRAIDRQVSRLRQKLHTLLPDKTILCTVWGDGYQLAVDVIQIT